ncbi:hypothetical protein RA19_23270 [Leisingera sp. ANG-M1]|uniref:hypothetical protein n=1 Tax=Leisingera sp. ANG-M1 TaxID=1577895 RepID=UPI00057E2EF9|nr:hypothetical protein [Leisingera sp. ANG-M1]KIC07700.1 hypothetical protein RA19_23270 [Leisingera sp. ANG-M1]
MSIDLDYLVDCKRARPDWTPDDGVASSFYELLIAMNSPSGYVWVAVVTLFLWKRNALSGALLAFLSLALLADWNLFKYNLVDDLYLGQLGGCVGSLEVANVVLLTASFLGIALVGFRVFRRVF